MGTLSAYLLGELLPEEHDEDKLRETEVWRVFYFYFPATLHIIVLVSLLFTIKYDSVKNLITKNKTTEAR